MISPSNLLPIETIELAAHRDYVEQRQKYDADRSRITNEILTELRVTRGQDFPSSMGGRLLVELLSDQRFQAFLEIDHGIRKPVLSGRHPTIYGEHRKS